MEGAEVTIVHRGGTTTEHWVTVVPRSSGRPVAPKKAAKVSAKQTGFGGGAWLK